LENLEAEGKKLMVYWILFEASLQEEVEFRGLVVVAELIENGKHKSKLMIVFIDHLKFFNLSPGEEQS
jgi:hypothetical protein